MKRLRSSLLLIALFSMMGSISPINAGEVPSDPSQIQPLIPGSQVPTATVYDKDGTPQQLTNVLEKPSVVIFYRGGWCPYCNKHLEKLQKREADLVKLGYQIVAISPDRPAILDSDTSYTIYSDNEMSAAKALGIAYQVDQPTLDTLSKYKIDIAAASGKNHHQLPVPAVFIVKDGNIQFTYVNPDYTKRLSGDVVYEAAKFIKKI